MTWHGMRPDDVLDVLKSSREGLNGEEAEKRLSEFGLNKLAEKKKTSLFIRFMMQFNDFMIIVLLAAAGVSFGVSLLKGEPDYADPIIILLIVILNAVLGLVQENKAEKALEALKKMSAPKAKVIREGRLQVISGEELAIGDVIVLETGDYIPADGRILSAVNLRTEEAALTGESLPSEKNADVVLQKDLPLGDRCNMVFSGSSVSYGRGTAAVTETGMNTEVGRIAHLLMQDEAPETPLQKKLGDTGKKLGIATLILCGVIFILGIIRSIPAFDMFMTSVSLAVAAIPEGLPAIVTIVLAIGVQKMAKRNAVIRKLPAVETLGGATVICSDKTGTLTQNKMQVTEVWNSERLLSHRQEEYKNILKLGALCNDTVMNESGTFIGDPTETALVEAAAKSGQSKKKLEAELPRLDEIPFDSGRKLMSTMNKEGNAFLMITKGAPDVLLEKCAYVLEGNEAIPLSREKRRSILQINDKMAGRALRVLGVAFKRSPRRLNMTNINDAESNLIFAGLVGMMDPPRDEVKQAVEVCKRAGIKPVMVTGDQILTAKAIGETLGIFRPGDMAATGQELKAMSQEELVRDIFKYSIFARVTPEQKTRIVKAFQANGAIVAMTGDGVNDAPALKAADIGCAMGISGTDVAKGAADMVLTDDNFATIVEAVREGRGIYANIRKAVHFLLSSNIGEIIAILSAIIIGWETPLLAIHLLWVNLVTDSLPAVALGLDPSEKDIMLKKPRDRRKDLFSDGLWERIVLEGLMIGLLAMLAFGVGVVIYGSLAMGRTMAFATLSISELVHAFNMRSEHSIFTIDILENKYLVGAFILGVILQTSVISVPFLAKIFKVTVLSPMQWLVVIFLSLMPIIIVELEKLCIRIRKGERRVTASQLRN